MVVGGTYRETCLEPKVDALRGSGMRAAAILTSLGRSCSFVTCVDDAAQGEAIAMAHVFGYTLKSTKRSAPVSFDYDTPVSTARWSYHGEPVALSAEAENSVAFGMVDADWRITADRLVLDPQHGDLFAMLDATEVGQGLAVVLNSHEAARLTGLLPRQAGTHLLARGAAVVVIKQGALGGLVFHGEGIEPYGPIPTETTRTIGSGDAFTAGFACAWFENPDEPLTAAQFGARVAAAHSLTDAPQVDQDLLDSLPRALDYCSDKVPKIYLAAPFFTSGERLLLETVRVALHDAGLEVFSPLHDVGAGGDEVAMRDLQGLGGCDAVLALLDGADPGTVFETGWATNAGIPVVGFTAHPELHDWTMLRGTGAKVSSDLTSAVHLAAWAAISRISVAEVES
jgi:nucleoside 2-deoxyribosyltransferase